MRALALDVGERRIGIAVCDPSGTLARPLCTLERRSRAEDFAAIGRLAADHQAELVVVGRPLTLRGEVGPQARRIERYAQALAEALTIPICLWDERYSTAVAEDIISHTRRKGQRRATDVDAVAAAVILQGFLDSRDESISEE